ncbi:glycosyltransferase [Neotamlana laminarinivorans]|uniref:Glycosyltransferase n=1 Tax=Neotamlana laminarinivorans TaxID=2883124 RepID=A0A9X1I3T5_9FLAO|nr:glycosyltransferase [Tamlana laminarinivorans]MCB4799697.1 glycosyltransferase [Tamlana laminarinivorans]
MKVLIVNTSDIGGAANACLRLHEGLLNNGIDSKVILIKKHKNLPQTFKVLPEKINIYKRVKKKLFKLLENYNLKKKSNEVVFLKQRSSRLELFSFPFSEFDITKNKWYQEADVVNLHWVSGFLDLKSFFGKNTKPVVWTMHDMNTFTGGEHYTETIIGANNNGNPIYRDYTELENQTNAYYKNYKTRIFNSVNNLTLVAPSKWLQNEALNSPVLHGKTVKHIAYGLNKEIFNIRDKVYSRNLLKLPQDKKVILFVAESLNNTNRKGFDFLVKAFNLLKNENVVLCAVGHKKVKLNFTNNVIELGVINDELLMSVAYSAADVFVIPSLMDNLPNTVLESLMCGTPVIGFPVGGILDMVKDEENGYIANQISANALKCEIEKFLDNSNRFMANEIRKNAIDKYDINIQAQNYINLYKSLLN